MIRSTNLDMDPGMNPDTNTTRWARQAVANLLHRLTARAARDLEAQAGELLEAARALRGGA